ncbi:hypothetical protein DFJ73DRAFT_758388 [Zopfochytrium polystomum]|nr:hypothetical protein DFJ73DRAFT_758388 [Zopfochytrium polystomum]
MQWMLSKDSWPLANQSSVIKQLTDLGYHKEAEFAGMIERFYDAFDTRRLPESERMAVCDEVMQYFQAKLGSELSFPLTATMSHFSGLNSEVVWGILMNAAALKALLKNLLSLPENIQDAEDAKKKG